jgi:hypothetical protein
MYLKRKTSRKELCSFNNDFLESVHIKVSIEKAKNALEGKRKFKHHELRAELMNQFLADPNPWDMRKRMEIGAHVGLDHLQVQKWHYDQRKRNSKITGESFKMTYKIKPKDERENKREEKVELKRQKVEKKIFRITKVPKSF